MAQVKRKAQKLEDLNNFLFISDLQIPFEHSDALSFCKDLRKTFKIPNENIYCVGDETDQYFMSSYKRSPDARHSVISELEETRFKLRKWYKAFPQMKLALSNHGQRYLKKALEAEIPSQMLRRYEEIIEAPPGWQWKKHWIIKGSKAKMLMEHGDDWGGQTPHIQAAMYNAISTIMGHHHSIAGVEHIRTNGFSVFGLVTGSLIDFEQYAFEYARRSKRKPVIGCGVVLDGGLTPCFIPMG